MRAPTWCSGCAGRRWYSVQAQGLITVRLDVGPEHEDEFNAWYDSEHVPQVTALAGFVRARRYICAEADIRYLAWYETLAASVEVPSISADAVPAVRR